MAILRWTQETRIEWHHHAWQAAAERLHRELQRPAARRTGLHRACPGPRHAGRVEVHYDTAAFESIVWLCSWCDDAI
jgi:hypothetical protein